MLNKVRDDGIICQNLTYAWTDDPVAEDFVIRDLSLTIARGEFVSFVGPSGCGKTTLLRLISGLLRPLYGTVHKDGRLVMAADKDLGFVFQDYSLFPWLSVKKNVSFGPRLQGIPEREVRKQTSYLLRQVGLWEARKKYPYQLSGGMKQRTAIARVIANSSSYLLMDEPFGALDYQTRLHMQQFLADISATYQKTVLFVTHHVEEAIFLSDRIFLMPAHGSSRIKEITVDMPKPRDITDPQFNEYRKEIISHLNQEGVNQSQYQHDTERSIAKV